MKFWYFAVIFVAVIMFALFIARGYIATNQQTQTVTLPSATITSAISSTTTPVVSLQVTGTSNVKGTIEGSLSYPGESLPENMEVCAESKADMKTYCDFEKTGKDTYKLKVPVGKYFVYAKIPDRDYYAYYSKFVTCGLAYECKDHTPIEIEVKANQTISKIDPQDWYNIQPSL